MSIQLPVIAVSDSISDHTLIWKDAKNIHFEV
jgi:hypothetical protein